MTTIAFTTQRGTKIELTLDGSKIHGAVNGAAVHLGSFYRSHAQDKFLIHAVLDGKDIKIEVPADKISAVKALEKAASDATWTPEKQAELERDMAHDSFARRMYYRKSDL